MDETQILSDAADTILDKPVTFDIAIKNGSPFSKYKFWEKHTRSFSITGASLGTMIKISKELLSIDLAKFDKENILDSNYVLIEQHAERMARIIAIAIVNNKAGPPQSLINFLLNNLTSKELQKLLTIVLSKIDITSFLTTIVMAKGMAMMTKKAVTNPPEHGG